MVSTGVAPVTFSGSADEQKLAAEVFRVLSVHGRFMASDAAIRVSVASVVDFLAAAGETDVAPRLDAALAANPGVFGLTGGADERVIVTTREGRLPVDGPIPSQHTFAQRFLTPRPKQERPALPTRVRPKIYPAWATLPSILDGMEDEFEEAAAEAAEMVAELAPEPAEDAVAAVAVDVPAAAPEPESVAEVEPAEEPEPAEPVAPPARTITLPAVTPTDVTGVDDIELANVIRERLTGDPRVANFGEQWMMEDRVPRFSRGDLRRMKEYLQEQEQPMTDDSIAQDVLSARPATPEFDLIRFAVDFRLSREHREFEFVGTTNQRYWTTSGLPPIGTTRRKSNEIGTDYRYLLDETPADPVHRTATTLDHILTFYEYLHGLLPFDAEMQALLPGPLLPGQKSAVLTFECPQSYTTYLVELRYPTPNRGGFILGLDDFYTENLVPGALLAITRTENDGHYRVEYQRETPQNLRLLELDERRAQRYVFRPTTASCGVDPDMLLSEERFGRLAGEKPLDEKIRRRPESVVAATFERIGENRDGNFSADFPTLLAGVNIERPISATLLRAILDKDDTGAFSPDPEGHDAYTYVPGTTP